LAPINLTMIGLDGRPTQKSLRQMSKVDRVPAPSPPHAAPAWKGADRIHILEGRQLVLLNIDEVIRIIRHSDEPKPALIQAFKLSDRQAEDILEIRLRQLARLEAIKIEQELKELREEQGKLEDILGNPASLKRLMIKEIESDAKTFADPPPHADPGREKSRRRNQGGGRTGHGRHLQQGLGACAHRPWPRGRQLRFQGGRRPLRHV
jgi:topoisomerase-4 subunit A